MLEHDISQETLPKETRLRRLEAFMKDYGTRRMDGDRITGCLKRLDETMNRAPISESIQNGLTMESVQRKRINVLSIGERTPPFRILSFFSDPQALILPLLDGGSSGLPALYTVHEILSRLAFDLKSNEELMAWRHFELMIGTGPGG
jgi:hypothetical protein